MSAVAAFTLHGCQIAARKALKVVFQLLAHERRCNDVNVKTKKTFSPFNLKQTHTLLFIAYDCICASIITHTYALHCLYGETETPQNAHHNCHTVMQKLQTELCFQGSVSLPIRSFNRHRFVLFITFLHHHMNKSKRSCIH